MKKILSIVLLALLASTVAPARATTENLSLDTVYAGYTPDGTPPWLTATFQYNVGSSTGTLTLTSHLGASDFVQGSSGVTGWAFYLDPNVLPITIQCTGGTTCPYTYWLNSGIGQQGPIPGTYNLGFGWNSKNRFDGSDTAVLDVNFNTEMGLQSDPFLANSYGIYSFSHIQGISGNPTCSGYVIAENGDTSIPSSGLHGSCPATTNVPEPESLGMFGFGALVIGVFLGLRRRRYAS